MTLRDIVCKPIGELLGHASRNTKFDGAEPPDMDTEERDDTFFLARDEDAEVEDEV